MYTNSHASQINARPLPRRPPKPPAIPSVEEQYWNAKARLAAAQQEKLEATVEFLAARAALSRWLEAVWPGQEE